MKILISESQVDKLKNIFSSLYDVKDYEGVCRIMVDYDEQFDKIVLNVFFDRKFAKKKGIAFNKVKNSVSRSMVEKAISWLNKTPWVYLHFEDCDETNN